MMVLPSHAYVWAQCVCLSFVLPSTDALHEKASADTLSRAASIGGGAHMSLLGTHQNASDHHHGDSKGLRIFTSYDKQFVESGMLRLWQVCGRRALGDGRFDQLVEECNFEKTVKDTGYAVDFERADKVAGETCSSQTRAPSFLQDTSSASSQASSLIQMAETTGPRSRSSLPSLTMAYFIISKS